MAIYKENIADVEIETGNVNRSFIHKSIGEGDTNGDRFGVRLRNHGEIVSLVGASCIGYFIRPDGITLVINGTIQNNVAYITLPEAAYAKDGNFQLTIKISGDGFAGTMRIVDGTVISTTTGDVRDPSSVIPTTEEMEQFIEDAEQAIDEIDNYSIYAEQITGTRYKIGVSISS